MPADFCLARQKIRSSIRTRRDIKQALKSTSHIFLKSPLTIKTKSVILWTVAKALRVYKGPQRLFACRQAHKAISSVINM
jgi:hypothetical protein